MFCNESNTINKPCKFAARSTNPIAANCSSWALNLSSGGWECVCPICCCNIDWSIWLNIGFPEEGFPAVWPVVEDAWDGVVVLALDGNVVAAAEEDELFVPEDDPVMEFQAGDGVMPRSGSISGASCCNCCMPLWIWDIACITRGLVIACCTAGFCIWKKLTQYVKAPKRQLDTN